MPLVAADIRFFLSGAASAGGAQANPTLSLGNFRSSTEIRSVASTFTSAASAGALRLIDTAQIGQSHAGKWLLVMGGLNAVTFATQVAAFNSGTGAFALTQRVPSAVSSGDAYQLFAPQVLFDNVSAALSGSGLVDYRALFVRNLTGVSLTALYAYLELVVPGPSAWALAFDDTASGDAAIGTSASVTDVPALANFYGSAAGVFEAPAEYSGSDQPKGGPFALANNGSRGLWLRRTVAALARTHGACAIKVVVGATNTGGTPSPIRSACLIPFSVAGITPALAVVPDRLLRISGGARYRATLTALETSDVLPEEDVYFDIQSGPGSLGSSREETGEDGRAAVTYLSPTDPLDAGSTVVVRARVGS